MQATRNWATCRTSAPRSGVRIGESVRVRNVAPKLGQHDANIFGRLGVSETDVRQLRAKGVL